MTTRIANWLKTASTAEIVDCFFSFSPQLSSHRRLPLIHQTMVAVVSSFVWRRDFGRVHEDKTSPLLHACATALENPFSFQNIQEVFATYAAYLEHLHQRVALVLGTSDVDENMKTTWHDSAAVILNSQQNFGMSPQQCFMDFAPTVALALNLFVRLESDELMIFSPTWLSPGAAKNALYPRTSDFNLSPDRVERSWLSTKGGCGAESPLNKLRSITPAFWWEDYLADTSPTLYLSDVVVLFSQTSNAHIRRGLVSFVCDVAWAWHVSAELSDSFSSSTTKTQ
jgi:hypothetical protein